MTITQHLECPENVLMGLIRGKYSREGGTIREAASGRIVTLLREANLSPMRAIDLVPSNLCKILQLASAATSLLNLGATVGFGIATLRRLNAIKEQLGRIEHRLDEIKWVVELSFLHTLQVLRIAEGLQQILEQKILTDLESAAELADGAQDFEPGSPQRINRLENALTLATTASRYLLTRSVEEMSRLGDEFSKMRRARYRQLGNLPEAAKVLQRFRHTCLAVSLKATIEADAGGVTRAGKSLAKDHQKLEEILKHFALPYFRRENYFVYDYLVHRHWKGQITFSRILNLVKMYDPEVKDEDEFVELLMMNDCADAHPIFEQPKDWHKEAMPKMSQVFELLEGATTDMDRVRGLVNELGLVSAKEMRLQDYREQLAVREVPKIGQLVYFELED